MKLIFFFILFSFFLFSCGIPKKDVLLLEDKYKNELVKLDHGSFENKFVVHSNLPEKARELLNDTFTTNFMNMRAAHKNFWFTIRGGSLHVLIEDSKDYFTIDSKTPIGVAVELHYHHTKMMNTYLKEFKDLFEPKARLLTANIFF